MGRSTLRNIPKIQFQTMSSRAVYLPFIGIGLLMGIASCRSTPESDGRLGADTTASQAVDTTQLGAIYAQIDAAYDSLMMQYDRMTAGMSPRQRELYRSMRQMHGTTAGLHRQMMSGRMMGGGMGQGGMMRGGGMMAGGMPGGRGMMGMREWDEQMLGMHQAMAAMHRQAGAAGMAAMHERMARLYGRALENTPSGEISAPETEGEATGSEVYADNCASCHGEDGRGFGSVFPPLAGSDWVTGERRTPVRILLHGLQGPVDVAGRTFDGTMPGFGARLSDQETAAVLTFIRSSWGNAASAVTPEHVQRERESASGHAEPYRADDLR